MFIYVKTHTCICVCVCLKFWSDCFPYFGDWLLEIETYIWELCTHQYLYLAVLSWANIIVPWYPFGQICCPLTPTCPWCLGGAQGAQLDLIWATDFRETRMKVYKGSAQVIVNHTACIYDLKQLTTCKEELEGGGKMDKETDYIPPLSESNSKIIFYCIIWEDSPECQILSVLAVRLSTRTPHYNPR